MTSYPDHTPSMTTLCRDIVLNVRLTADGDRVTWQVACDFFDHQYQLDIVTFNVPIPWLEED